MNTAILNKPTRIFLAAIVIVAAFYPLLSKPASSATLTSLSDTMTRQKVSVVSDHVIRFTTPTGIAAAGTITINFNTSSFSTGSTAFGDVDFTHGASTGLETSETLAGTCSGATWGAAFATNVLTITSCSGTVTAGDKVIITIGLQAAGGANQITNPGSGGSKSIPITAGASDSGTLAVPILTDDQVTVSATVDPTITSTITGAPCIITPALTASVVDSCSYTNQVVTNAVSGYASTMLEDDDLETVGDTAVITDVSDGTVTDVGASAEYGASTSSTNVGSQDILVWDGACETNSSDTSENASPITTTAKRYADHGGPIDETTTICHSASIIGTTPAGSYSHVVTHITTGTF